VRRHIAFYVSITPISAYLPVAAAAVLLLLFCTSDAQIASFIKHLNNKKYVLWNEVSVQAFFWRKFFCSSIQICQHRAVRRLSGVSRRSTKVQSKVQNAH